jgi:hypothetical protein
VATSSIYGVGVRDATGLRLLARIARRPSGIFYLIPRTNAEFGIEADRNWDPHVSYHTDGRHHVKSFDQRVSSPYYRQPLDQRFSGAEPLFDQSFQPGELSGVPALVDTSPLAQVFEIPAASIDSTTVYVISVSLLAPHAALPQRDWLAVVAEQTFRDAEPWIHVALCTRTLVTPGNGAAYPNVAPDSLQRASPASASG